MDPEGEETGRLDPDPEKSQVAIGFVKHSGTDPLKKQSLPRGPTQFRGGGVRTKFFLEEGPYGPLRNTLMAKTLCQDPPSDGMRISAYTTSRYCVCWCPMRWYRNHFQRGSNFDVFFVGLLVVRGSKYH